MKVLMLAVVLGMPAPEAARQADVAIIVNLRAKEVRFTQVPDVRVTFSGSVNGVANATVHENIRTNLPEQVQPYVTYRDVGIRLTITSTLPNIEQILDEALGPHTRTSPQQ